MSVSTISKNKISEQLNATLPTFEELAKTLAGHSMSASIVSPFVWACGHDDRTIINIAMNNMCVKMQDIPFSENNGKGEYFVKDYQGRTYPFSGEDFDCLLKIMFCSWLQIGIIDEKNSELYYQFIGQDGVYQVLN